MAGDDRVRHCSHCSRNVYNLSGMTREEAERLILQAEGRVCVRYYKRPDGGVMTQDCPRAGRRQVRVQALLASLLSALGFTLATPTMGAVKPSPQLLVRHAQRRVRRITVELAKTRDPEEREKLLAEKHEELQRMKIALQHLQAEESGFVQVLR